MLVHCFVCQNSKAAQQGCVHSVSGRYSAWLFQLGEAARLPGAVIPNQCPTNLLFSICLSCLPLKRPCENTRPTWITCPLQTSGINHICKVSFPCEVAYSQVSSTGTWTFCWHSRKVVIVVALMHNLGFGVLPVHLEFILLVVWDSPEI